MTTLEHALAYLAAHYSIVPVTPDGLKTPATRSWKEHMREPPSESLVREWYARTPTPGIAFVCGEVSLGLEVIDFDRDADSVFPAWLALVEAEWPDLLNRVSIVKTPKGYHVWLRCPDMHTPGNAKLAVLSEKEKEAEKAAAKREGRKAALTIIETRGEGGYALVPGCPPACHETGRTYEHHSGRPLVELDSISIDERDFLVACARSFDRSTPAPEPVPRSTPGNDLRPGDDFDRRGWDWADILPRYGWELASGSLGGERRWRRPGKPRGWSATTGRCASGGADLLRVFSSNADPFEDGRAYGKFRALALLECNGDLARCAAMLRTQGFGSPAAGGSRKRAPQVELPAEPSAEEDARAVATIADLERCGSEVSWLWEGWLPRGVLVAVAAEGGTGKTRFCADLVRRVRHGAGWPDGRPIGIPADSKALWVVSDNHHDEMVSLARSFGIESSLMINAWADDPYGGVNLEDDDDFRDLELRVQKVRPALVVVDTVGNATDRNLSRQEDARAFYQPLQVLARRYRTTVLCLTHLNASGKFLGRRVMEKVRVAIRMEKPDPDDPRRSLEVVKTNSRKPEPLGLTMGDGGNEYDSKPPKAPQPLEPGMPGYAGGQPPAGPRAGPAGPCADWLRSRLSGGPARVSALRNEAEAAGYSAPVLYRAMKAVYAVESVVDGRKWWSIAASDDVTTPWD